MHKKPFLLILLLILGIAVVGFYKYWTDNYVTYTGDPANSCLWVNGSVSSSTEVAGNGKQPIKHIKKSDENTFIAYASKNNQCWFQR